MGIRPRVQRPAAERRCGRHRDRRLRLIRRRNLHLPHHRINRHFEATEKQKKIAHVNIMIQKEAPPPLDHIWSNELIFFSFFSSSSLFRQLRGGERKKFREIARPTDEKWFFVVLNMQIKFWEESFSESIVRSRRKEEWKTIFFAFDLMHAYLHLSPYVCELCYVCYTCCCRFLLRTHQKSPPHLRRLAANDASSTKFEALYGKKWTTSQSLDKLRKYWWGERESFSYASKARNDDRTHTNALFISLCFGFLRPSGHWIEKAFNDEKKTAQQQWTFVVATKIFLSGKQRRSAGESRERTCDM